jgi:hypothetical protein
MFLEFREERDSFEDGKFFDELEEMRKSCQTPAISEPKNLTKLDLSASWQLRQLSAVLRENDEQIIAVYKDRNEQIVQEIDSILEALKRCRTLRIRAEALSRYFLRKRTSNRMVVELTKEKEILTRKYDVALCEFLAEKTVIDVPNMVKLLMASRKYDENWGQAILGTLSPDIIQATVQIINGGDGDSLLQTISVLADEVFGVSETPQLKKIVFPLMIQALFDRAYVEDSPVLNEFSERNTRFVEICRMRSAETVSSFGLEKLVVLSCAAKTIREVFGVTEIANFEKLQFLVNPLDMAQEIVVTIQGLTKHLKKVTRENVVLLVSAIVIARPPCNVFSLCRFLEIWISLMTNEKLSSGIRIFVEAANIIGRGM